MRLLEWDNNVSGWMEERGLESTEAPMSQVIKLVEESGELATAHSEADFTAAIDAVGDTITVLKSLCMQGGIDFRQAFLRAENHGRTSTLRAQESLVAILHLNGLFARQAGKGQPYQEAIVTWYLESLQTIIINTPSFGFTLLDAMEYAWNEIKDRRGVLYKGLFIKELDVIMSDNTYLINMFNEKYNS